MKRPLWRWPLETPWHRIQAAPAPRVAAQQTPDRQHGSSPRPVLQDRRRGVARTARMKAAALPGKRPEDQLIAANGEQQQTLRGYAEAPPDRFEFRAGRVLPPATGRKQGRN